MNELKNESNYLSNFIFFEKLDQFDNDIYFKNVSLEEKLKIALNDKNCIGFNTLGFFKNKFEELQPSKYFKENDGIFIKKDVYENKLYLFLNNTYEPSAWVGHLKFADYLVKEYKPNIIVDLGVDYGHSTFAFAGQGIGTVYGIDWFEGDIHAGTRNTYDLVKNTYQKLLNKKYLPKDNLIFVKGDFNELAKIFDKKIDILHIDGLHTYEAVKNDFNNWFPKTDYNSIILFHDVISFSDTVGKFFNEIKFPKLYFKHSAGLGVMCQNKKIINNIYSYYKSIDDKNIFLVENSINNYKNICFIHSCTLLNKGTYRLDYLINYLKNSDLYNHLDKIYINNIGMEINNINNDDKFEIINYSNNSYLYEIPTLNKIVDFSIINENCNILYIHNKGISYEDNYHQINDWINMMLYFLIDKYNNCIEKLKINDVVGSNYSKYPHPHFSGNFWWATSNYLKTLEKNNEINVNKADGEWWLFKNNPKYDEMHNSKINHYLELYDKNRYIN